MPFGLAPAILAGTWTALVLRARAAVGWLGLSVAAGLVGTGLVLAGMLALVGWGRLHAGQVAANWLFLSVLAWMALAPLVAAFAPVQRPPGAPRAAWAANLVGGILGTVLLVAGFVGLERLLPPGS